MAHPDYEEFLAELNAKRVRYLIGGAHALALHARPRGARPGPQIADAEQETQVSALDSAHPRVAHHPLFFSSQILGSQSSTLLPSGSIIHANLPFSWVSGPWMTSMPEAVSCATISSILSIR